MCLIVGHPDLVCGAIEAVPAAALTLYQFLRLTVFARQTAHRLRWLWLLVRKLNVGHVQTEFAFVVLADFDPTISARGYLVNVENKKIFFI